MFIKRGIGSEFFPDSDESQFSITYKTPIGTRVERTEQATERLEEIVQKELVPIGSGDAAQRIYTTLLSDTGLPLGRTAIFSQNTGTHSGSLSVNLVTRGERPVSDVWAAEKVRAALRDSHARNPTLLLHRRHREAHPEFRGHRTHRRRGPGLRPRRRLATMEQA